jgi:hypothetical protein
VKKDYGVEEWIGVLSSKGGTLGEVIRKQSTIMMDKGKKTRRETVLL